MCKYTLGKKGCYTPIEDNKSNVDRTFVFPLGWNWHDMDTWLFPNEIRHYPGQTFNARSSGIVELRNHSIGGRSPKSIFTLWQLWINICIFFQKFFWLCEQCPVQPLWVLGMRCLHLPLRALSKVLLLPVWVWLVLPSTAYSKGMLSLDLWYQASLQGLPERQHLGKTVHCWGWSDRIVSWVLGPWWRGWEICTEWGLVAQWLTTDSCPVVTGHIDPQRSPCWLPTTVVSAWSGRRGGGACPPGCLEQIKTARQDGLTTALTFRELNAFLIMFKFSDSYETYRICSQQYLHSIWIVFGCIGCWEVGWGVPNPSRRTHDGLTSDQDWPVQTHLSVCNWILT